MSSRDPSNDYRSLPQALQFFGAQLLKRVQTAVPGNIVSYDESAMRADVQPGCDLLIADGRSRARARLLDVPVVWPGGAGWRIRGSLAAGDAVLVVFCERDISNWKRTRRRGPLASPRVMSSMDAFAVPVASPGGSGSPAGSLVVESNDGGTAVTLTDGAITLKADRVRIDYSGGQADWP